MYDVDFIRSIVTAAQAVEREIGMFTSVTIAQACLETGYNSKMPVDYRTGEESFNMFGMKAVGDEPYVMSETWELYSKLPSPNSYIRYEVREDGKYKVWLYDKFRKFESLAECFLARADFLTRSTYWTKALKASTPEEAIHGLQHTGHYKYGKEVSYATDDQYESKILSIINRYSLKQYDLPREDQYTEEELKVLEELTKRIEDLEKEVTELRRVKTDKTVAKWAVKGFAFVTTAKTDDGVSLSDGTRPKDSVTREELWTTLERFNRIKK